MSSSATSAVPTSSSADRPWILRGDTPAAVLVPRAEPLPTKDDVDEAYRRGCDAGRRDAETERAQAVLALQDAATRAQRDLAMHLDQARASTISLSVDLAIELARWLVNQSIEIDPTLLRNRIAHAVDAIADERDARFVVSPPMVELVRGWLGPDVAVEADPGLELGELRLDAGHASLDATYEVALGRARDALIRSFQHWQPEAPILVDHVRELDDVREPV